MGQEYFFEYFGASTLSATLQATLGFTAIAFVPMVIFAILWMGISYFLGDSMMLGFADAQEMDDKNPQFKYVYKAVENVALAAGLPTPKVYIIDDDSLNAFATGRDPNSASVALTTGIIKKLDRLELEGVIAHEMAHIGNRDIRLDMLIITGLGVFGFMAELLSHSWRFQSSSDNKNSNSGALHLLIFAVWAVLMLFNFLIAPLINFAISRAREYAADATGALITRNPKALASALEKISQDARVEVLDDSKSMSLVCIASPLEDTSRAFSGFDTHPPINERVARLRNM
jgi:heat shock protein HtpX